MKKKLWNKYFGNVSKQFIYLAGALSSLMLPLPIQAHEINSNKGTTVGKTTWYNCNNLPINGKGWTNTKSYFDRLPETAEGVVRKPVWHLSQNTSGMLFRFKTNSNTLNVRWSLLNKKLALPHMPASSVSGIDLYGKKNGMNWQYINSKVYPRSTECTAKMYIAQFDEFMLYLPLYNGVKKVEIGINSKSTLHSVDTKQKQVVFYGSSITQGACASRAGLSYTAIIGRNLDVEIINLGFSGNGKMEPELSDLLCELDPSLFVLDCLWNITAEMAKELYEPFVRKIVKKHPKTPILIAEDCNVADISPTEKGLVAHAVYTKLKTEGISNLYYLSNKGMLGDDNEATVDGVHPNDLGMMRMANTFTPVIKKIISAGADIIKK